MNDFTNNYNKTIILRSKWLNVISAIDVAIKQVISAFFKTIKIIKDTTLIFTEHSSTLAVDG